jgi:hypothetical protein
MVSYIVIALFVLVAHVARADKLADFQEALRIAHALQSGSTDEGRWCDTIPYSELRSTCKQTGDQVHPWCDGDNGPVKCEGTANDALKLKVAIENAKRDVETAKDNKDKADRKRQQSGLSEADKLAAEAEFTKASEDLNAKNKQLEQTINDLEARQKLVKQTLANIDKCIKARSATMVCFDQARTRLPQERDSPEIIAIARELQGISAGRISTHQIAIHEKENSEEGCKERMPYMP